MRNRMAFLSLGLMAAAGLLTATAMAADPDPTAAAYKFCAPSGSTFTVSTDGPMPCGTNGANTCLKYTVGGTGTPDHVGTFVRFEAGKPFSINGSSTVTTLCGQGDGTLGLGNNLTCHEYLVHWNNQQTKTGEFSFTVSGKRKPIITSVVVKKGGSQWSCPMVGVGFEDTSSSNCVQSCGNFDPKQGVIKKITLQWEECEITKYFNTTTGAFLGVTVSGTCHIEEGDFNGNGPAPIIGLQLDGDTLQFADGEGTNGTGSCYYAWYGGGYSKVCNP